MWHEMRKQSIPSFSSTRIESERDTGQGEGLESEHIGLGQGQGLGLGFSSSPLFDSSSQSALISNKLRESLRSSAIELARVRQVKIISFPFFLLLLYFYFLFLLVFLFSFSFLFCSFFLIFSIYFSIF